MRTTLLVKPSSASCNMACTYCFYEDLAKTRQEPYRDPMDLATMKNLIKHSLQDMKEGDELAISFQGGEPTLRGLDFYKSFVGEVDKNNSKNIRISYNFQTNGLLIDGKWAKFFKEKDFLVGLSLDGYGENHRKFRPDKAQNETFSKTMEVKKLLEEVGVDYNILTVLTNDLAQNSEKMWDFIRAENIRYIQFIPCIGQEESSLQVENFYSFYTRLFKLWKEAWDRGTYISIGLFDSLISYLGRNHLASCGLDGFCSPQYVIESDGSIYPCDFYSTDPYLCGNINKSTLKEALYSQPMQDFLQKEPLSKLCQGCDFVSFCRGGCKRLKNNMYLNKEENYCGFQMFLRENAGGIDQVIGDLGRSL